ncbi:hypothetical protein Tco_0904785 [Tanacetum coccineum]
MAQALLSKKQNVVPSKEPPDQNTDQLSANVDNIVLSSAFSLLKQRELAFLDEDDAVSALTFIRKGVLVMGKFPLDAFFENTATYGLVKWMRDVMNSDNPRQAIDTLLLDNGYEKKMLLALKIAYYCTLDNPKYRPDSKTCRIMLAKIEHYKIENSEIEHFEIDNSKIKNSEIEHFEIEISKIALIS